MKKADNIFWFLLSALSVLGAFIAGLVFSEETPFALAIGMGGAFVQYQSLIGAIITIAVAIIAAKIAWAGVEATFNASKLHIEENEKRAGWALRTELDRKAIPILQMHVRAIKVIEETRDGKTPKDNLLEILNAFKSEERLSSYDFLSKLSQEDYSRASAFLSCHDQSLNFARRFEEDHGKRTRDFKILTSAFICTCMWNFFSAILPLLNSEKNQETCKDCAEKWRLLGLSLENSINIDL